ncbi:uncharacterized protein LOC130140848 [Syzygium oleosum]|uniref:uncharacterized protein LOC130140848 n=1 Tax=Syzygium oleosum TaxID=219896 RepID=UPI0024BB23A6|nr:uncharacterized protein LOC130140848 [Syzygium oleosum]
MTIKLLFLGLIISVVGLHLDEKVKTIRAQPTLKTGHSIERDVQQGEDAEVSSASIEEKLCSAQVFTVPDFSKLFEVDYDVSGVWIGVVLSQEKRLVAFFTENLSDGQKLISSDMHAKGCIFLQKFPCKLLCQSDTSNRVTDALSRRAALITTLRNEVAGFGHMQGLYNEDENSQDVWEKLKQKQPVGDFHISDGFLKKGS